MKQIVPGWINIISIWRNKWNAYQVEEDALKKAFIKIQDKKIGYMGARLWMSHKKLMYFMEKKHVEYQQMPDNYVIIIDSYDSACFQRNNKGSYLILSYNTLM